MINKNEAIELLEESVVPAMEHCLASITRNAKAGSGFTRIPFDGLSKINTLNHKFIMFKLASMGYDVDLSPDLSSITVSWF